MRSASEDFPQEDGLSGGGLPEAGLGETAVTATSTKDGAGARDFDLVLILSGGNALGAFQAGVYEALHEARLQPDWIVGTSIGAINGALIAGTDPAHRLATLSDFWRSPFDHDAWWPFLPDVARRTTAAGWTLAAGRAGLFGPALFPAGEPALYEMGGLRRTLLAKVDFDRLNNGPCRYTATAVDLETGEDVTFDSSACRIDADHVRASAALPVLFPPVEIDGRWMVDGGMSANLPLDPFFVLPPRRRTLCIAVDLLPPSEARPGTIGEAGSRAQDLLFAAQSRRSLARWQDSYASHGAPGITLAKLTYERQRDEIVGKAFDFSNTTLETRWRKGRDKAGHLLAAIEAGELPLASSGLAIHTD